jgi:Tfp pilus assembly protein PilF
MSLKKSVTMKRILSGLLVLGIGLTSTTTAPLAIAPAWGQTQNLQNEELQQLLKQGVQQTQQGESQRAIETLQKVLAIARQLKARDYEATALLGIGRNFHNIGQQQRALELYNQALTIFGSIGSVMLL